jgi:hypothetical protein
MQMTKELQEAIGELIAAHLKHKEATEIFLASPCGGDPDDEKARARQLEIAHIAVAAAGSEVAQIAMQYGTGTEATDTWRLLAQHLSAQDDVIACEDFQAQNVTIKRGDILTVVENSLNEMQPGLILRCRKGTVTLNGPPSESLNDPRWDAPAPVSALL